MFEGVKGSQGTELPLRSCGKRAAAIVGGRKQKEGEVLSLKRRDKGCVVQGLLSKDIEKLGKSQKKATEMIWSRQKSLIKRDLLA